MRHLYLEWLELVHISQKGTTRFENVKNVFLPQRPIGHGTVHAGLGFIRCPVIHARLDEGSVVKAPDAVNFSDSDPDGVTWILRELDSGQFRFTSHYFSIASMYVHVGIENVSRPPTWNIMALSNSMA